MLSLRTDVSQASECLDSVLHSICRRMSLCMAQVLDELKRYVTKEDLEEQYSNLLRSIEDMQSSAMQLPFSRLQ